MKQIKKISLANVINKLTRNEMRYVMAGSGGFKCTCGSCSFIASTVAECLEACNSGLCG